jgi:hypothetical protein
MWSSARALFFMTNPSVPTVTASAGVREPPDKPWDDEIGCTCGAGLPCECNTGDAPDISQIIEEKNRRGTSLVDPKSVGDL